MCWAHVDRAVDRSDYLAAFRAEDKEVANKIMDDFNTLQWTANDEMIFRRVFELLEKKHISTDNQNSQAFTIHSRYMGEFKRVQV